MMRLKISKFDLENVLEMVKLWKQDNPNDLIYFQLKTSEDEIDFSQNGITESDDDDILYEVPHICNKRVQALLLFLHITQAQRELLQCYNNLVLMDATYRTCRLMLPTFFLAVKTNVGYSPVAMFIPQMEDATSICDAAQVWGGPRATEHTKECLLPRRPGC